MIVRAPDAVVVEASSVSEPVVVPAQTDVSSAPATVMVTVMVSVVLEEDSVTVIVNASVTESPASSASVSESALFRVYVHAAPLIVKSPYVPAAVPIA